VNVPVLDEERRRKRARRMTDNLLKLDTLGPLKVHLGSKGAGLVLMVCVRHVNWARKSSAAGSMGEVRNRWVYDQYAE
jgi:hypothetical protein